MKQAWFGIGMVIRIARGKMIGSLVCCIGLSVATGHAATVALTDNSDYNVGPILAASSAYEDVFQGVSLNIWEDNGTAFSNNATAYAQGLGMRTGGGATVGWTEWWLDGNYASFSGTARMDGRSGGSAWARARLYGDGVQLTNSAWGASSTWTFTNVNVTGVKRLQLQLENDGWGGRPTEYAFWTQADVVGNPGRYYNDTLNATTSTRPGRPDNYVTFTSAANQVGSGGTNPSVNVWLDTSLPLKLGGQAVSGIGVTGPQYSSGGSVKWTLSPSNDYRLFTFDVGRDDRWASGYSDGNLKLLLNGVLTDQWQILDPPNGGPVSGWHKTCSYLLSSTTNIEFQTGGGGWGGATKAYYVIMNPRLVAIPPPRGSVIALQ